MNKIFYEHQSTTCILRQLSSLHTVWT